MKTIKNSKKMPEEIKDMFIECKGAAKEGITPRDEIRVKTAIFFNNIRRKHKLTFLQMESILRLDEIKLWQLMHAKLGYDLYLSELIGDTKVLTLNELTKGFKRKANLINLLKRHTDVNVIIPETIFSINPSFLAPWIKPALKKYGLSYFKKHVIFFGKYNFSQVLERSILRDLREINAK